MLNITTNYAIHSVLYLAAKDGEIINSKTLSNYIFVSQNYLQKFMRKLIKADIVQQHRGVNGGYTLAKSPKDISIFDIISVMENTVFISACVEDSSHCIKAKSESGESVSDCLIHSSFATFQNMYSSFFSKITIDDLVRGGKKTQDLIIRINKEIAEDRILAD